MIFFGHFRRVFFSQLEQTWLVNRWHAWRFLHSSSWECCLYIHTWSASLSGDGGMGSVNINFSIWKYGFDDGFYFFVTDDLNLDWSGRVEVK